MTFVVCPNLAVDRVVEVPALLPGATLRGRLVVQQTGGKGANVVRAVRALGGHALLAGFAAGAAGRLIAELAAREAMPVDLVVATGEARVSTVVLSGGAAATKLFEYGPRVGEADEQALLATVRDRPAAPGEWAIVDGAAPPGSSPDFYAALAHALREGGYNIMVDATGVHLAAALAQRPEVVKVNDGEARAALDEGEARAAGDGHGEAGAGHRDAEDGQAEAGRTAEGLRLCRRLRAAGARDAVVTLGSEGAVALIGEGAWHVPAPAVAVVNTTGSGDCFAGSLLVSFERGQRMEAALAAAAGAAAANAADPVTGRFDPALAARLAAGVRLRPLSVHTP